MAVISVSIEPREEDRQDASDRVMSELLQMTGEDPVRELLIQKEMKIIQAERLRERVKNFGGKELESLGQTALR